MVKIRTENLGPFQNCLFILFKDDYQNLWGAECSILNQSDNNYVDVVKVQSSFLAHLIYGSLDSNFFFIPFICLTYNQDCGQPQDHEPLSWQRQQINVVLWQSFD